MYMYFCVLHVSFVCKVCYGGDIYVLFVWSVYCVSCLSGLRGYMSCLSGLRGCMSGLPFFLPTSNIASVLCTCIGIVVKHVVKVHGELYRECVFQLRYGMQYIIHLSVCRCCCVQEPASAKMGHFCKTIFCYITTRWRCTTILRRGNLLFQ